MNRTKTISIAALALLAYSSLCFAQTRKVVHSVDDLPQASYPIAGSVEDFLTASPQKFEAVVAPIRADIERILSGYDIADAATLRTLLAAKLGAQIATGAEDRAALATIQEMRKHQDKDEARLISGLAPEAFLEARIADGTPPGACPRDFQANYARHLSALPWAIVGVAETRLKGFAQIANTSFMIGLVAPDIQPTLELDFEHAVRFRG